MSNAMVDEIKNKIAESKAQAETKAEVPAIKPITDTHPAMAMTSANWGAIESMETSDLLVPKIYHQQAMSKFVQDGLAKPGDFCDSMTGQVLAKREDKLEVIVFGLFKTMLISKLDLYKNQYRLEKTIMITPQNAHEYAGMPLTAEIDGDKYKHNLQYNFYCLLPGHMDGLPYVLSLGSTKTKAARKLNTMLYALSQQKRPGPSVVFELGSVQEKNDQGSWYGLEITQGRNSTEEEMFKAYAWYVKSKTQTFVAQESDDSVDVSGGDIPF